MKIRFQKDILYIFHMHFLYLDDNDQSLKDSVLCSFLNSLDRSSRDNESILMNESNVKKILDFFNDENRTSQLEKEILQIDGLDVYVEKNGLYLIDIKHNNNGIHSIICDVHVRVKNDALKNIICEKREELFKIIKENEDDKFLLRDLRSSERIEISGISIYKDNRLNLRLEANYNFKKDLSVHLKKFKEKRMFITTNQTINGAKINLKASFGEQLK